MRGAATRRGLVCVAVGATAMALGAVSTTPTSRAVDRPGPRAAEALREQRAVARLAARGLPIFCGGGRANEVALTFDDGPTPLTPRLLAALRRSSQPPTPATFFLIGRSAVTYRAHARAEAALGAVGAHTLTHSTLTKLATAAARRELAEGKRSVERAIGAPVRLFRPPGGHRSPAIDRLVAEQSLLSVLYTVDPRDWARPDAGSIAAAVVSDRRLVPGAIVVLHEFHRPTIEAIPAIVHSLRRCGLRLVSVPRLLADDPPTLAEQHEDARAGSCVHLYRRLRARAESRLGDSDGLVRAGPPSPGYVVWVTPARRAAAERPPLLRTRHAAARNSSSAARIPAASRPCAARCCAPVP